MRIWVDCTAVPHPIVLRPIVEMLRERGHEIEVTAREMSQTLEVLERLGIDHEAIGRHGRASRLRKAAALASRSTALARWARGRGFDLGLAHGSVDLAVVGKLLRIPTVQMQDYEWAGLQRKISWRAARRVIVPDAIPLDRLERAGARAEKLFRYPGMKEEYYLADFAPDAAVLGELGLEAHGVSRDRDDDRVLLVVRPPAETAAYHERNPLYEGILDRIAAEARAVAVVLPRSATQANALRARPPGGPGDLVVPARAIDAQSLIAVSDVVVGAGGTMNREAAALGTPVYTIFTGRLGAVDERLLAEGRMRALDDPQAMELRRRDAPVGLRHRRDPELLVEGVLAAVE